jgi:prevent-host-death family protein
MKTWTLQDAKARFSELVKRAKKDGPQLVTRRGEEAVVVLDVEEYRSLTRDDDKENLADLLRRSPLVGLDPKLFERSKDTGREIEL